MRRIIIVGASSGIGNTVARDFIEMGFKVGVAARSEAPLRQLRDLNPEMVDYEVIDVTARDAGKRLLGLIKRLGGMDILLLVSGVGFQNTALDMGKEMNMLETNVVGFARIIATAYRYYRDCPNATTPGQIAAITSVAGTKGIGVAAAYSASKRFQQNYLEALDQLSRKQGVDVAFTDIRPGFIRTPLLDGATDYIMEMDVKYASKLIEAAVLKRKRVATVDWRWRVVTALWSMIPSCLWTKMDIGLNS
ncbi:MAG: SDR family NAD(P)-dependent oxidoreductase [Duncaniella sp.]|nr:SDR family NAD(P)-dependent oxidoreductase [Duncaniella sp.]